jgi:hypothetical protein
LLVTQLKNGEGVTPPASIACLVVPVLSHNFDSNGTPNEILNDGLERLRDAEKIGEFKSWVKNQRKCPFFELPLEVSGSRGDRELRTLFVAVLPCQLPMVRC